MTKNTKTKNAPSNVEELTSVLKWRLGKALAISDVELMLDKQIISKEEAKQLLFNEVKESDDERVKALTEQVKYQQGLIDKLASSHGTVVWPHYVQTYTPSYPVKYWISSGTGLSSGAITTNAYSVNTASNTVNLSSNLLGSQSAAVGKIS